MYNWITVLYTWNQHDFVNQLYSSKIFKNWKKKKPELEDSRQSMKNSSLLESDF